MSSLISGWYKCFNFKMVKLSKNWIKQSHIGSETYTKLQIWIFEKNKQTKKKSGPLQKELFAAVITSKTDVSVSTHLMVSLSVYN